MRRRRFQETTDMKQILSSILLLVAIGAAPAFAAEHPSPSPEMQKLDVSVGRWVFHGETPKTPSGKAGEWTWKEDCQWSEDREFLLCSFDNVWSGKHVKSLVADTWNDHDHAFWHYELFNSGAGGAEPFAARMTIDGNTRVEHAEGSDHGKPYKTRITYVFDTPTHVDVKIETAHGNTGWVTVAHGEGVKQG
jgi:hypothetical protein